jgi:hypothetical protein
MVLRELPHRFQFRLALLALVALAVAQLGATTHAYSHDAAASTTHRAVPSSHNPCNDCLAYAPLLSSGAAPGPLPTVEPQGRGAELAPAATSLIDLSPALAFRSRAPPDRA